MANLIVFWLTLLLIHILGLSLIWEIKRNLFSDIISLYLIIKFKKNKIFLQYSELGD